MFLAGRRERYIDTRTGDVLLKFRVNGWRKNHAHIVVDGRDVAYAITPRPSKPRFDYYPFTKEFTSYVLRTKSAFEGQVPFDRDTLVKAGLELEADMKLYLFAKIERTKQSFLTAKTVFSVAAAGGDEFKQLYVGERLSGVNFHCIVKTAGNEVPVLELSMKGDPTVYLSIEVSAGTDIVAAVLTGLCTWYDNVGNLPFFGLV